MTGCERWPSCDTCTNFECGKGHYRDALKYGMGIANVSVGTDCGDPRGTITNTDGTTGGWPQPFQAGDPPIGKEKVYPIPGLDKLRKAFEEGKILFYPEPSVDYIHDLHVQVHMDLAEKLNKGEKLPEGVEKMTLYKVWMIYGGDRKNLIIDSQDGVLAKNEEDAKIKSGLMQKVNQEWDADYLTFICQEIGDVNVKAKPKEVKQV